MSENKKTNTEVDTETIIMDNIPVKSENKVTAEEENEALKAKVAEYENKENERLEAENKALKAQLDAKNTVPAKPQEVRPEVLNHPNLCPNCKKAVMTKEGNNCLRCNKCQFWKPLPGTEETLEQKKIRLQKELAQVETKQSEQKTNIIA